MQASRHHTRVMPDPRSAWITWCRALHLDGLPWLTGARPTQTPARPPPAPCRHKPDLVVCTNFDHTLLGCGLIPSLNNLKHEELLRPSASIMPAAAKVWAMAVQVPRRRLTHASSRASIHIVPYPALRLNPHPRCPSTSRPTLVPHV